MKRMTWPCFIDRSHFLVWRECFKRFRFAEASTSTKAGVNAGLFRVRSSTRFDLIGLALDGQFGFDANLPECSKTYVSIVMAGVRRRPRLPALTVYFFELSACAFALQDIRTVNPLAFRAMSAVFSSALLSATW